MEKTRVMHGHRLLCRANVARGLGELGVGLSGKKSIGKDEGLLMVFPSEGRWLNGIWMAGMRFQIDVVFLSKDRRIVGIEKKLKPLALNPSTWRVCVPEKSAKYAVEINAGRSKGLKKGDLLRFTLPRRQPF